MSSKLGYHIERTDYHDWLTDHILRAISAGCPWVKIIKPWAGQAQPFGPDAKYLGRLWWPDEPDKELIQLGAAGADTWFRWAKPLMDRTPWIRIWEGPNEPAVQTIEQCVALASFEAHRVDLMHEFGLQTASLCISTGCPEPEMWPYLGPALAHTGFLDVHEYGMGRMELDGWHLLRYRKAIAALRDAGYRVPPILVTETGIDLDARPDVDGWLGQGISGAEYMAQIAGYDHAAQENPEVVALFLFTVNPNRWTSYDIHRHMSARIADYMESQCTGEQNMSDTLFEMNLGNLMQESIARQTPGSAFYKYARLQGWPPAIGNERDWILDGVDYRAQVFYTPGDNMQHIVYTEVGNWGGVRHFDREN